MQCRGAAAGEIVKSDAHVCWLWNGRGNGAHQFGCNAVPSIVLGWDECSIRDAAYVPRLPCHVGLMMPGRRETGRETLHLAVTDGRCRPPRHSPVPVEPSRSVQHLHGTRGLEWDRRAMALRARNHAPPPRQVHLSAPTSSPQSTRCETWAIAHSLRDRGNNSMQATGALQD